MDVPEARLHRDLFKNYNKHSHPILAGTGPVVVTFDFQLIRILDVVSRKLFLFQLNKQSSLKFNRKLTQFSEK